ncbi:hypothetical protein CR513_04190, partial [Mucuna pruriens]
MKALEKSSTWEIVNRFKDRRVVGCRWIYIVKYKSDGPLSDTKQDWLLKVAHFGWNLQQFVVKKAFLHGDLEEEVYMEIPPRFYSHNEKNKSPRAWFGRFAQVMISLRYKQSQDDMIVIGDDEIEKLTLKEKLAT